MSMVKWFVCHLLVIYFYHCGSGSAEFIRFKPNNEYIYEFQSNADLKSAHTITAHAKVRNIAIHGVELVNKFSFFYGIHFHV